MRARIVLIAGVGVGVRETAKTLDIGRATAQRWRVRWRTSEGQPFLKRLCDAPRLGTPPTFKPEQICESVAMACESPSGSGQPFTQLDNVTLAAAAAESGIVESISAHSVGRFLRDVDLKPLDQHSAGRGLRVQVSRCLQTYRLAPVRAAAGIETRCIDEMTGMQALGRAAPTRPILPGRAEPTEFEYIRHSTTILTADFDVVTGCRLPPRPDPH